MYYNLQDSSNLAVFSNSLSDRLLDQNKQYMIKANWYLTSEIANQSVNH